VTAFLVGMGEGSYFGFSNMQDKKDPYDMGGWYDASWTYFDLYDQLKTGKPLGPAQSSGNRMKFKREFVNGNVTIDCSSGAYSLSFPHSDIDISVQPSISLVDLVKSQERSISQGKCLFIHGIRRCFARNYVGL